MVRNLITKITKILVDHWILDILFSWSSYLEARKEGEKDRERTLIEFDKY